MKWHTERTDLSLHQFITSVNQALGRSWWSLDWKSFPAPKNHAAKFLNSQMHTFGCCGPILYIIFWRENLWKLNLVRPEVINGFSFFYILNRKQQSLGKKLQFWILSNHHQLALLGVSFHLFFLLLRSKYQFSTLSAIY